MNKKEKFIFFIIFNIIFGLCALAIIVAGIWSMIKIGFHKYILIFIVFGLYRIKMFIIGFFIRRRPILVIYYLVALSIISALELTFVFLMKFVKTVNDFIIHHLSQVIVISEEDKNIITRNVLIIIGCDIFVCVLSIIVCVIYYKASDDDDDFKQRAESVELMRENIRYTKRDEGINNAFHTINYG